MHNGDIVVYPNHIIDSFHLLWFHAGFSSHGGVVCITL